MKCICLRLELEVKRSEMIKLMIDAFEEDYDDSRHMSEENADRVLSAMEDAGILPPEASFHLPSVTYGPSVKVHHRIRRWEDEEK